MLPRPRLLLFASLCAVGSFFLPLSVSAADTTSPAASTASKPAPAAAPVPFTTMEADLARTVKEQADFYRTAPLSALPAGLTWETGADLPEFADPQAKQGGTLRGYIPDFPRTLRTIGPDATGGIREYLLDDIAVSYVHPHPNLPGRIFPGLALAWAADAATKTVYFRLDPAARFSDGRPVTTADAVYTFYMMRSPLLTEPWYNDFYTKTYAALTVYDPLTIAVTLKEWKPDAVLRAAITPYPRHAFADFGPNWIEKYQWRTVPTTGAYELLTKNVEKGRSVTLTAVPNWWAREKRFWRGRFNPARLRLDVIRDPEKAFEAFVRGDLDMIGLNLPKFWYEKMPDTHPDVAAGYVVKTKFFNQTPLPDWGLWINRAKTPLDQLDVRLGVHLATNFDLVCSQYFRGDAVRPQTRSDGYGWNINPAIKARPFAPAEARAAFARAGYTEQGPDGVLRDASGRRLSFTITAYSQALKDMLPILQQEALKAGLEFKLEVLDTTTGWKKVQEKNHEIALVALGRSVEPYPRYWEVHHGSNAYQDAYLDAQGRSVNRFADGKPNPRPTKLRVQTNNMTATFNPRLDELIEAYDRAESMDEIKRLALQIEQLIYDDAAWVNGWAVPFYRLAYPRYIKWPQGFNVMQSRSADELYLHWIDQDEKKELAEARRAKRTYPPQILTFEQFKN